MKTLLDEEIAPETLGILYLCRYCYSPPGITVTRTLQFKDPAEALDAFANIPNPESQMAAGRTRERFLTELENLHKQMKDPKWLKDLANYL